MESECKRHLLIDGNIPAGKPCPWERQCGLRHDHCPTAEVPRGVDFSCALARGLSSAGSETDEEKAARWVAALGITADS